MSKHNRFQLCVFKRPGKFRDGARYEQGIAKLQHGWDIGSVEFILDKSGNKLAYDQVEDFTLVSISIGQPNVAIDMGDNQ